MEFWQRARDLEEKKETAVSLFLADLYNEAFEAGTKRGRLDALLEIKEEEKLKKLKEKL